MVQVGHLFFLKAATSENSFIKKSNQYNFLNPCSFWFISNLGCARGSLFHLYLMTLGACCVKNYRKIWCHPFAPNICTNRFCLERKCSFILFSVSLTSSGNEEHWLFWQHRLNKQVCGKLHSILHFNPVARSYSPVVIPSMGLLFCKSRNRQSWSARGTIYDNCTQVKCFAN